MNTAQQVMMLMLKLFYYDQFEDSLTDEEHRFCRKIKKRFAGKEFTFDHTISGKLILRWHSICDITIACYVSKSGFQFSEPEAYKPSTRNMKGPVKMYFHPGDTRHEIVEHEIEDIKKIILGYAPDAQKYFI
ncbi:MAG: hypothetical protein WCJ45_00925 [bacterium]